MYLVPAFESSVLGFGVELDLRDEYSTAPFQSAEHREMEDLLPRGARDHDVTHLRLRGARDVQQPQLAAHSLEAHTRVQSDVGDNTKTHTSNKIRFGPSFKCFAV